MSGVVKYIFGTEKSVLLIKVSSIQGCPYRGVPLYHVVNRIMVFTHPSL